MSLKSKVVIVTGASKGIGKSIAQLFHSKGANVCLISRSRSLKKTFNNFSNNKKNLYFIGDATDENFIKKVFINIYNKHKKIDALINNAGVSGLEKIHNITEKRWDYVINNNLKIENPIELENQLNQITGVVTNGLFAKRSADTLLIAKDDGIIKN